ncbi:MAG: chemotaxis protein CheW [Magnetococcus sp. DMHC-6]
MSVAGITEPTQFLTFYLATELFAVDIAKVREVLEFAKVTKVPRTPEYMLGVINLRGSVVPVVDMRAKFHLSMQARTVDTCIIIIEVSDEDGERMIIGAMADSVREVFEFSPDQIDPPPKIGVSLRTDFIQGMGKFKDQFIIILDTDKVFSAEDLAADMLKESKQFDR